MSVWLTTANSLLEKLGFGCVGCNNLLVQWNLTPKRLNMHPKGLASRSDFIRALKFGQKMSSYAPKRTGKSVRFHRCPWIWTKNALICTQKDWQVGQISSVPLNLDKKCLVPWKNARTGQCSEIWHPKCLGPRKNARTGQCSEIWHPKCLGPSVDATVLQNLAPEVPSAFGGMRKLVGTEKSGTQNA
jgi:hypothetical protein